eukprot:g31639.t1
MQPLTAIMDALEKYSLVITPHATQPFPIDGKQQDERQIILAGQFNFGFVGLAATATTFQWLDFWGERLRYYGFAIPSEGMHFDQNWGDTILSYFPQEKYFILRDPRYNIAYWNLHYRGKHLHMVKDKVMYGSEPSARCMSIMSVSSGAFVACIVSTTFCRARTLAPETWQRSAFSWIRRT